MDKEGKLPVAFLRPSDSAYRILQIKEERKSDIVTETGKNNTYSGKTILNIYIS